MATESKFGKVIKETGNFIKENPKPILWIGGSIVVVVIAIAAVKSIKNKFSGKGIKGGIFSEQTIDNTKTTINSQTAKNYAENLFRAFNYSLGTDKSVIESVFSKINSEDFKMIYNAFGTRSYSIINGGTSSGKWLAPDTWVGSEDIDLVSWLNEELDFTDTALKNKIRPIVNGAGFILEE